MRYTSAEIGFCRIPSRLIACVAMNPWQQPPGQPGWPMPPTQQPYGQPGYPPPPRPSGATAITAAVLSFLGCAIYAITAVLLLATVARRRNRLPVDGTHFLVFMGMVLSAVAVALLVGGVMLLCRRLSSRVILIITCATSVAMQIVALVFAELIRSAHRHYDGPLHAAIIGIVVTAAIGVPTTIVALAPATKRWCLARTSTTAW
ncbi:hypothetical protein ACAG26_09340 [Mycobacterium sp. pUA109]|uniref:hypothetical protein n=1 Tax=Mycobacterium sp. pUA109 TaxID=3238982 RepID=UPI00351AB247